MKDIYCIFVFLIPLLAGPAYARVLSVRPGDELGALITIFNNYGRKTPSPPPSPSVSPSTHRATNGATADSDSNMSRIIDLEAPLKTQSDQRISRNTASPPPVRKSSATPIQKTRAPPPPPKKAPTPVQKNGSPPPPPKGSTTPTQKTRAPPPPQKTSLSPDQLGSSSFTARSTTLTPSSLQSGNQMMEKFSGTTRAPPYEQLGSTFLCNRLVSMVTDYGCRNQDRHHTNN